MSVIGSGVSEDIDLLQARCFAEDLEDSHMKAMVEVLNYRKEILDKEQKLRDLSARVEHLETRDLEWYRQCKEMEVRLENSQKESSFKAEKLKVHQPSALLESEHQWITDQYASVKLMLEEEVRKREEAERRVSSLEEEKKSLEKLRVSLQNSGNEASVAAAKKEESLLQSQETWRRKAEFFRKKFEEANSINFDILFRLKEVDQERVHLLASQRELFEALEARKEEGRELLRLKSRLAKYEEIDLPSVLAEAYINQMKAKQARAVSESLQQRVRELEGNLLEDEARREHERVEREIEEVDAQVERVRSRDMEEMTQERNRLRRRVEELEETLKNEKKTAQTKAQETSKEMEILRQNFEESLSKIHSEYKERICSVLEQGG